GYTPPRYRDDIRVMGKDMMGVFHYALYTMHQAGLATDHDLTVSTKVAEVLTGGNVLRDTLVSEQHLLDLEREAFVSLCGTPETQARIRHMLTTGKPLRN
ncbi:MAG: 3-hydroxyacyl-CoA dehydrogenase, partial [Proteobacteria bacterium]|nr:3-hydroxyacyl-CoA dehydrogenase [Pseudomonadota bacterium]